MSQIGSADQPLARLGVELGPIDDRRLVGIERVQQHAAERHALLVTAGPPVAGEPPMPRGVVRRLDDRAVHGCLHSGASRRAFSQDGAQRFADRVARPGVTPAGSPVTAEPSRRAQPTPSLHCGPPGRVAPPPSPVHGLTRTRRCRRIEPCPDVARFRWAVFLVIALWSPSSARHGPRRREGQVGERVPLALSPGWPIGHKQTNMFAPMAIKPAIIRFSLVSAEFA